MGLKRFLSVVLLLPSVLVKPQFFFTKRYIFNRYGRSNQSMLCLQKINSVAPRGSIFCNHMSDLSDIRTFFTFNWKLRQSVKIEVHSAFVCNQGNKGLVRRNFESAKKQIKRSWWWRYRWVITALLRWDNSRKHSTHQLKKVPKLLLDTSSQTCWSYSQLFRIHESYSISIWPPFWCLARDARTDDCPCQWCVHGANGLQQKVATLETAWDLQPGSVAGAYKPSRWAANSFNENRFSVNLDSVPGSLLATAARWSPPEYCLLEWARLSASMKMAKSCKEGIAGPGCSGL